ncbi:hypothetical protein DYBT9275_04497 [Dyadobacter sp. CECT 9275]|uniref:Uncharacterized protein n=1 Tax=Dyadobacter helix TaxID=2822344 RepID=A0A916JI63_9BACT|nr:hypothetical protein [Dyadobacter sp. CECT 9275]CAG5009432.1 hypothetical protein DYBT9275_04497 [Dyadobacter sp. CECT 9275]
MKRLLALLMFVPFVGFGQVFYVAPTEKGFENKIVEKMKSDGYKLAASKESSDYVIDCLVDGSYKAISVKKNFHGYLKISDTKTGNEIYRTEEVGGSPSVFNGYQAGSAIMEKIAKKHLNKALAVAKLDYKKRK